MASRSAGSSSDTSASGTKHGQDHPASRIRSYPPRPSYEDSSEDLDANGNTTLLPLRGQPRYGRQHSPWPKAPNALNRRIRRALRRFVRMKYVPARPVTVLCSVVAFGIFAVSLTSFLIWYLNPDKEALPWRAYCSVPRPFSSPHIPFMPKQGDPPLIYAPPFPPANLDELAPAGVFLGVFSIAKSLDRRMLIRSTWATHPYSRNGAGAGDMGLGTSRTIVRFVMGKPAKEYEALIAMENETYHDIVVLPTQENMNSGKTHTFFTWAAEYAWVPPVPSNASLLAPYFSYSANTTEAPSALAPHDPSPSGTGRSARPWVRPDFVLKSDDDSFVMLAELEARLRVELHSTTANATAYWAMQTNKTSHTSVQEHTSPRQAQDPLIYWGYLVKSRFMGGEIYGISWPLVAFVATNDRVRRHVNGAEDKVTARWMNMHPQARDIRWTSERCWIYNHPRSRTVYAHGFLFPSEAKRAALALTQFLGSTPEAVLNSSWPRSVLGNAAGPPGWAASTVSTFGKPYSPPVPGLTPPQAVEALVEGAEMSLLFEGGETSPEYAWSRREGRQRRYESMRVGGTVVVHFVKSNAWFLETAQAMLAGEEIASTNQTAIA